VISWPIQKAVYAALKVAPALPVYDEVPPDDTTPYIVLGAMTEVPDDDHSDLATSETMMLHVWSRAAGSKEAKELMADVNDRLHQVTLYLTGGGSVRVTREFVELSEDEQEPGERWRHGVMRYRVRTQEAV